MKQHIAVVKWEGDKIAKYQDFDTQSEADTHISSFGGFVVPNPGGNTNYWIVDEAAKTVVNDQAQADADSLASDWGYLRSERNALLTASDWTQGTDSPLDEENKVDWAMYRQELRDLPANTSDLGANHHQNQTWPTKPTGD